MRDLVEILGSVEPLEVEAPKSKSFLRTVLLFQLDALDDAIDSAERTAHGVPADLLQDREALIARIESLE